MGLKDRAIEHFEAAVGLNLDSQDFRNDLSQIYKIKSAESKSN